MKKITFLGLGIMGFPMARHLKKAGLEVVVWNRNSEKSAKFVSEFGGNSAKTPAEAAQGADFVMMCLGNDASVEEVALQILPSMEKGATLIDHTTTSANLSRKIYAQAKDFGVNFLEAPMTGGQAGAENAKLTMMCGGDEDIYKKSLPILQIYAPKIEYFGSIGAGQTAKMVNQICIAGIIQSLAEAINFAEKSGLDTKALLQLISEGAGSSWQMKNRHELMISKDYKENFGFPVEWMLKDLNICIEAAKALNIDLPITEKIRDKYKEIKETINPRFDTSSLILLLH